MWEGARKRTPLRRCTGSQRAARLGISRTNNDRSSHRIPGVSHLRKRKVCKTVHGEDAPAHEDTRRSVGDVPWPTAVPKVHRAYLIVEAQDYLTTSTRPTVEVS